MHLRKTAALAAILAVLVGACTREEQPEGQDDQPQAGAGETTAPTTSLLTEIQERGTLRCGVNNTVPGFGFETAEGRGDDGTGVSPLRPTSGDSQRRLEWSGGL